MPKFTVELAYTVLSTATVQVEAANFEEACAMALEDPPYDDFEDNCEATGETYVLQIEEGDVDLCFSADALANVPLAYQDEADRVRAEFHEALALLRRALFVLESPALPSFVNGAGLVDALRAFSDKAAGKGAPSPTAENTAPAAEPLTWGAAWEVIDADGQALAMREGWLISAGSTGDRIERDDCSDVLEDGTPFATDDDAIAHVRARAAEGSLYHRAALAIHDDPQDEEG